MRLTIFNGSPRGTGSNTDILLKHFTDGYLETIGNSFELIHLNQVSRQDEFVKRFSEAEVVIIAFPLYTDAMPGMVKTFFESLSVLKGKKNPPVAFIVQSGFNEAIHTKALRHYLTKLVKRLDCELLGIASKGSIEGIQVQPPMMTKGLFKSFRNLGRELATEGRFSEETTKALAGREKLSTSGRLLIRVVEMLKVSDTYWEQMMKKNDAFEKRYDKPSLD